MKVASGNIPKEIVYIVAAPQNIKITWDDATLEDGDKEVIEKVYPTFVSDASNAGTMATGREWAKRTENTCTWVKQTQVQTKVWTTVEVARKNEPFKGLRIYGLNYRYNGGRAWKCADDKGYYFDLREDVLLDLMRTVGIAEGGYLNGEYIWAKVASEMKIVRVGSDLHSALIAATDRREMPVISKKELKPNHIYQQKNGSVSWYGGKVTSFEVITKFDSGPAEQLWNEWVRASSGKDQWAASAWSRKYGGMIPPPRPPRLDIKYKQVNGDLWIDLNYLWNDAKTLEENFGIIDKHKESILGNENGHWNRYHLENAAELNSSKKFVADLGELLIPSACQQIRDKALKCLQNELKEHTNPNNYYHTNDRTTLERSRLISVANLMQHGTVTLKGTEMDQTFDFWITEIISKEPK